MTRSGGDESDDDGVEWMDGDAATVPAAAAAVPAGGAAGGEEDEDEEFEYSDAELDDGEDVDWEDVATPAAPSASAAQSAPHAQTAATLQHPSDTAETHPREDSGASDDQDDSGNSDDDGDEMYEEPDEEATAGDESDDDYESDGDDEQTLMDLQRVNWEQVNQVLQQEAAKATRQQQKQKQKRKAQRMSRADKERELALHESHLLLLLATQLKWNALCQSPVLRGLLLSLTCDTSRANRGRGSGFDFYTEMKSHPLKYSLEMLVRWFSQHFQMLSASDATAGEHSHEHQEASHRQWSELLTESRLMQVFFDRQGRDYELAVLFTALCRALRLYCRHTSALDALLVQQSKAFESSAASPASVRSRKRSRTRSGAEANTPASAEIASTQSFWIWTEVLDEKTRAWVHVDALRKIVAQPREVETLRGKSAPFSYVVSLTHAQHLVDVTPRYATKWSKTLRFRIADKWFGGALKKLNAEAASKPQRVVGYSPFRSVEEEDELLADERAKLLARTESEEMPASLEGFKKHHLYCLERHLGCFECVYPRKAVGIFNGQPVFLRKHIQVTRSAWQWRRLGREVKDADREMPAIWYKKGKQPQNATAAQDSGDDSDENGENSANRDGARAMFGVWQTSAFVPPPVVNGIVPKNSYGNIELWSAAHVPRGAVHVQLPRIEKVVQQLGVDFAPAVVGFEVKGDRNAPKFDGIVVAESVLELLTDAHAHMQQSTIEKAIEKNQQLVAKRWERLVQRLLLRQRLEDDYGAVSKASPSLP